MKSNNNEFDVLQRLNELEIVYSRRYDIPAIDSMSSKYFKNKLRYSVKTKEIERFGKKVSAPVFQERTIHLLDKAILKYYYKRADNIIKHLSKKPTDLKDNLPKYKDCVNNMIKVLYHNPFVRNNTIRLWKWKKNLVPKLLDGEPMKIPNFNENESIDNYLI